MSSGGPVRCGRADSAFTADRSVNFDSVVAVGFRARQPAYSIPLAHDAANRFGPRCERACRDDVGTGFGTPLGWELCRDRHRATAHEQPRRCVDVRRRRECRRDPRNPGHVAQPQRRRNVLSHRRLGPRIPGPSTRSRGAVPDREPQQHPPTPIYPNCHLRRSQTRSPMRR